MTDPEKASARYALYDQYHQWKHGTGRFGKGNREPLPVCVEAHVKATYPAVRFTWFKHSLEEEAKEEEDARKKRRKTEKRAAMILTE